MSKVIEVPDDLSELSRDDALYLHQRGRITDDQLQEAIGEPGPSLSEPRPVEDIPHTGDANTAGLSKEDLEERAARMAAEQGMDDDEDEDEDDGLDPDDYDSATNDQLRAELARRGLSVEGNKAALIERLQEDDGEEE